MPDRLDLPGSRNETWNLTIEYGYAGTIAPLDGATARLQWRLYPGAPGDPVIDLPGDDGTLIFEDVAATDAEVAAGESPAGGRFLRIYPSIETDVLQALPGGLEEPEPGEADVFSWDISFTLSDGTTWVPIAGEVWLAPGVTE